MIRPLLVLAFLILGIAQSSRAATCEPGGSCGNIVFDGDSVSVGVGASKDKPDQLLAKSLSVSVITANVAAGGRPVRDCLARFDQLVAPRHKSDAPFNLIVFHAGDNDVAQGMNAETAYQNFTRYVRKAHQDGWLVVVSTELPRPNFDAAKEAQLVAYNRRLVANTAAADAVLDLSVDTLLNGPSTRRESGLYIADLVHPNDAGYARLNGLLTKAVETLLAPR